MSVKTALPLGSFRTFHGGVYEKIALHGHGAWRLVRPATSFKLFPALSGWEIDTAFEERQIDYPGLLQLPARPSGLHAV